MKIVQHPHLTGVLSVFLFFSVYDENSLVSQRNCLDLIFQAFCVSYLHTPLVSS